MTVRRFHTQDYTGGWVCALPIEFAATVAAILDEKHQSIPLNDDGPSLYALGCIDKYIVVLASLPLGEMGTNSTAVVGTRMQLKFPLT